VARAPRPRLVDVTQDDPPRRDVVEEATRLLEGARRHGVALRLVGGLAIRMHATDGLHPAVERTYGDIDLVAQKGKGREAAELLRALGYQASDEFNAINGHRRLLFHDERNARQLDVFVGSFAMCHEVPVADRFELDAVTVPLAELLLTKLQVVELNEKDQRDILALLYHHPVADSDSDVINGARIAALCAADWGLWRTCKLNLERTADALPSYAFSVDERELISDRVRRLWNMIEQAPKSSRWRLRERIGDRKRWYQEPEEVGGSAG
jgi:hypothetical protein